jgi:hypothetical protein
MSSANSVDNNVGFLVYTVTSTTGNNTSYSVIADPGTEKRILILQIVCLLNRGITTNSSEKLFQNEQSRVRVNPDFTLEERDNMNLQSTSNIQVYR